MGECDRSEVTEAAICETRRWFCGVTMSTDCVAGRPFSNCGMLVKKELSTNEATTNLLLRYLISRFDSISTFDYICLETDWTWPTMKLKEQATGIAQH